MPNVEAKADVKIGSSATATIRLLMELSPELNAKLEELAKETKASETSDDAEARRQREAETARHHHRRTGVSPVDAGQEKTGETPAPLF